MNTTPYLLPPDDLDQTAITRETVLRYHLAWKVRDIEAVMALYHPDVTYEDYYQNRILRLPDLREYALQLMPSAPGTSLDHDDRIRVDGNTAFIQYRICVAGDKGLFALRSSEAITVKDEKIWRVREYATLVHEDHGERTSEQPARQPLARLGLNPRLLAFMAQTVESFLSREQPYLDPEFRLQSLADATGYTRNQLSYLLNQVFGQTFYQYVNQARLRHVLDQLAAASVVSIDRLAFEAGFRSLSVFYTCFRKHTGVTPTVWLQQHSVRTRKEDS